MTKVSRSPGGVISRSRFSRLHYYRRIFSAYLGSSTSQLSFWHEMPEVNPDFQATELGAYYMTFSGKADYSGGLDIDGVPLLDYKGAIGPQYNPIAIAQYALGNYNLYIRSHHEDRKKKLLVAAQWLSESLTPNNAGLPVWMHNFDWEYRDTLKAPWYSGLAQGQGISALLRAHQVTGEAKYLAAASQAFRSFQSTTSQGGVMCYDSKGNLWIEEYIVTPPTHILNGCIWALWGIYDYFVATGDQQAKLIFARVVQTLRNCLPTFDTGFWSLYEQSGTWLSMISSPFYHSLHIVQLRVMSEITGDSFFGEVADRWVSYRENWLKRNRALAHKAVFKVLYY